MFTQRKNIDHPNSIAELSWCRSRELTWGLDSVGTELPITNKGSLGSETGGMVYIPSVLCLYARSLGYTQSKATDTAAD